MRKNLDEEVPYDDLGPIGKIVAGCANCWKKEINHKLTLQIVCEELNAMFIEPTTMCIPSLTL